MPKRKTVIRRLRDLRLPDWVERVIVAVLTTALSKLIERLL